MTVMRLKSLSTTKPIARELPDSGKWTYEAKLDGLPAHGHRMINKGKCHHFIHIASNNQWGQF
jgi:hypothetical protein